MRVLIVHNTLNDSNSVSGVLKHYLLMARAWIDAGVQVDFLLARAGFRQVQCVVPEAGVISSDNIFDASRHISKTWTYLAAYGWRMLTVHFQRFPVYNVVYASSPFIFEVHPAQVIARRQGARLAVKFHHILGTQQPRKRLADRLILWSEKLTLRWINRRADLIFCNTKLVEADLHLMERSLGLKESQAKIVGCGLDMGIFPPAAKPQYDVVMLGRIHEHKGVFDLPEVWQRVVQAIPGARLLVIGEGPHRDAVQRQFAELKLTDSARFTGGITEHEKLRLLSECKIGLSLSFEEGWGLSITEFLAAGLPVVAYGLKVFDLVFPGQLRTVPLGDKAAAAREIIKLLQDEAQRAELAGKGREFVQCYDYRNVARVELNAMRELVEK